MGDDIGSSSVTDCLLRSFSDHRWHTQQCRAAPQWKSKQMQPQPMSSPINYSAYSVDSIKRTVLLNVLSLLSVLFSTVISKTLY